MLRFIEKEKYNDREGWYDKNDIQETFTRLCKKLNVYSEASCSFDLSKSDIFQKIF